MQKWYTPNAGDWRSAGTRIGNQRPLHPLREAEVEAIERKEHPDLPGVAASAACANRRKWGSILEAVSEF